MSRGPLSAPHFRHHGLPSTTRHSIPPIRLELLDSLGTELVGAAGRGEVSVENVEVFRMVSVGTSILGDLDDYATTAATPSTAKSRFTMTLSRLQWQSKPLTISPWRE